MSDFICGMRQFAELVAVRKPWVWRTEAEWSIVYIGVGTDPL
jgi:hypothetical protein